MPLKTTYRLNRTKEFSKHKKATKSNKKTHHQKTMEHGKPPRETQNPLRCIDYPVLLLELRPLPQNPTPKTRTQNEPVTYPLLHDLLNLYIQ